MDDTAPKPKPTLADLIAYGRAYLQALEEPGNGDIDLGDGDLLKQYLIRANEGLAMLQSEEARKKPKKPGSAGGAPAGNGMGDQVLRLIANGMGEQRALRVVEGKSGKPRANVLRSFKAACKKAAALSGAAYKKPGS